jgi:hypothetical protein
LSLPPLALVFSLLSCLLPSVYFPVSVPLYLFPAKSFCFFTCSFYLRAPAFFFYFDLASANKAQCLPLHSTQPNSMHWPIAHSIPSQLSPDEKLSPW